MMVGVDKARNDEAVGGSDYFDTGVALPEFGERSDLGDASPYLEDRTVFQGVHALLIQCLEEKEAAPHD